MTGLRRLATFATVAALGALPSLALAQGAPGYYAEHMMWGGGWFLMPLMMVFWFALIVGAVILIVRWLGAPGRDEPRRAKTGSDALDILRARFAKGDIDKAEFEERRALLEL
jgi:putative membrane protein